MKNIKYYIKLYLNYGKFFGHALLFSIFSGQESSFRDRLRFNERWGISKNIDEVREDVWKKRKKSWIRICEIYEKKEKEIKNKLQTNK